MTKQKVPQHECYYAKDEVCRCFERPAEQTHDTCRNCNVQGLPLTDVRLTHDLKRVERGDEGFEQAQPVVATLWTCPPCAEGLQTVVNNY